MRFSPTFLDEIRARVPVSEVVRQKVAIKKQGREWRGLSPFNSERTPSFYVNDPKGFFHDFSSGKHGDGFTFLMETEGISFPEAVAKLAAMAGLPMPVETAEERERDKKRATLTEVLEWAAEHFQKQLRGPQGREARDYLARREISPAAQAQFRLGYAAPGRHDLRDALAAKGATVETMIEAGLLIHGEDVTVPYDRFRDRVMFPICDRAGVPIAFGGRALAKDAQAKYLNSPETELFHKGFTLYNLHNARKAAHEAGTVIAVEGYIDVIAMTAAGFPHCVAPLGTALTSEQCGLLWRMGEEPILCFDGDKAGLNAAYRAIDTALPLIEPGKTLRFVLLPGGQDPDELLRSGGPAAVAEALRAPLPLIEMLWRRETEGKALETPERRAGLERRFRELSTQIRDPSLRRHYGRELDQRLRQLLDGRDRRFVPDSRRRAEGRRRSAAGGSGGAAVTVGAALAGSPLFRGVKSPISPRECLLLLIFVNHPSLIGEFVEDLVAVEFESREARALQQLLVEVATSRGSGDLEAGPPLEEEIEKAGLGAFLSRLEGMAAHANLWSVRKGAAAADAAVSLRQVLSLHRKVSTLNRELRAVERRLADDPCEEDQARLAEIRAQLSAIDGTEASLEGFGSMSGRMSRAL
ncbi:MAG: DNA primase [Methylocystis sp.]